MKIIEINNQIYDYNNNYLIIYDYKTGDLSKM